MSSRKKIQTPISRPFVCENQASSCPNSQTRGTLGTQPGDMVPEDEEQLHSFIQLAESSSYQIGAGHAYGRPWTKGGAMKNLFVVVLKKNQWETAILGVS